MGPQTGSPLLFSNFFAAAYTTYILENLGRDGSLALGSFLSGEYHFFLERAVKSCIFLTISLSATVLSI